MQEPIKKVHIRYFKYVSATVRLSHFHLYIHLLNNNVEYTRMSNHIYFDVTSAGNAQNIKPVKMQNLIHNFYVKEVFVER